jgi:negative regulator of replication initiation
MFLSIRLLPQPQHEDRTASVLLRSSLGYSAPPRSSPKVPRSRTAAYKTTTKPMLEKMRRDKINEQIEKMRTILRKTLGWRKRAVAPGFALVIINLHALTNARTARVIGGLDSSDIFCNSDDKHFLA